MVIVPQRKASFIKHSVPFTVAISLICPVSGGLRAQEIKKTATEVNPTTFHSNQSGFSRDSSLLTTSPVSTQNPQPTAIISPTKPLSSLDITPTNSEKYSLTKLEIGGLSAKTVGTVNKNQFTIAQQTPTQDLAPNPTSQEPLAQSNQPLEENKDKEKSPSSSTSSKSDESNPELPVRLYIGSDFFYRNYSEEEITPGFKSNEFGTLYGVQANLNYVKGNAVYFGLGFRYGGGQTKYDGGLQDGQSTPFTSKTDNQFFNLEGRLGYTFRAGRQKNPFLISPFVAVGYHQWNRDISGDGTTPSGSAQVLDTREKYSWGYIGPGFHAEYKISPKFTIGLNAKLMFMLGTDFDLTTSVGNTVTNQGKGNLGKDFQYEIELPLTYTVFQNSKNAIDLKLTPYYRSQDIARGPLFETSNGGSSLEPASTTSVYGATFGIQFRF
jgi:hypothetical protein